MAGKGGRKFLFDDRSTSATSTSNPKTQRPIVPMPMIITPNGARNTQRLKFTAEQLNMPVSKKYLVVTPVPERDVPRAKATPPTTTSSTSTQLQMRKRGRPPKQPQQQQKRPVKLTGKMSKRQKGYFPHLNWLGSDSSEDDEELEQDNNSDIDGGKALEEQYHVLDDDEEEEDEEIESATIMAGDFATLERMGTQQQKSGSGDSDSEGGQQMDKGKENRGE